MPALSRIASKTRSRARSAGAPRAHRVITAATSGQLGMTGARKVLRFYLIIGIHPFRSGECNFDSQG